MKLKWIFIYFCLSFTSLFSGQVFSQPFVTATLMGQFGNQLFITAAAIALAYDHEAVPIFPDFTLTNKEPILINAVENYNNVFCKLDNSPLPSQIEYTFKEKQFSYSPIEYRPNMSIFGWFQSEKYFEKYKEKIIELFSPSPKILNSILKKYSHITSNPNTVSIHLRSYLVETPQVRRAYQQLGREYVQEAIALFPENTTFVVFSNDMEWCKRELDGIAKDVIFIEGESLYNDFYLMSLCKHNIICNSSFSWWAAYINQNPNKMIVAPKKWFDPNYKKDTQDLIPDEWIVI